jgi:crotonobetainyl-CoA:carnitine CoA-transferase CaiB-like acyl-CoA transferase
VSNSVNGSLTGTLVLDASRVLAGPFAGQLLGDHGAEVIKVEAFTGDDTRGYGPPFVDGTAPYFLGLNRNKKDLALDLSKPEGIDLLFEMLEQADVFIENFKASTWAKWGVSDSASGALPCVGVRGNRTTRWFARL